MSTILECKKLKNIGLRSISHLGIFMAGHTSQTALKNCHIPSLFQSWHINGSPHLKSALYTVVFDFLAAVLKREKDKGISCVTDRQTHRQTDREVVGPSPPPHRGTRFQKVSRSYGRASSPLHSNSHDPVSVEFHFPGWELQYSP